MADRANWCCWPASVVFTHTAVILLTTPHHSPLINCWWPADGAVSNTENIFLLPDWNSAALNSSDYSDRRYCAGWCIIASCNIQPYPQWPRLRRVGRWILQRVYHYCATCIPLLCNMQPFDIIYNVSDHYADNVECYSYHATVQNQMHKLSKQ